MKIKAYHILVIISFAIGVFFINNAYFKGYLNNEDSLAEEIWAGDAALSSWPIGEIPPFKYRFLFQKIVKGSFILFFTPENDTAFYFTYVIWSVIFLSGAAVAFYYFLNFLGFSNSYALAGSIIFLLSPPILLAYSLPVHTREDPLAYLILCCGLIAILREKALLVLFISCIGVLCRETLLILPFVYLFFSKDKLNKRLFIASLTLCVAVLIRILLGYEPYNILSIGFIYNLYNVGQTIGFFYITFGLFWIMFLFEIYRFTKSARLPDNPKLKLIYSSAPWAFLIIFTTTFLFGRLNELRLLFLLFPWVISLGLYYIKSNTSLLFEVFKNKYYVTFASVLFAILTVFCILVLNNYQNFIPPSKYDIPFEQWIVVTFISIFLSLSTLPIIIYSFQVNSKYNKPVAS